MDVVGGVLCYIAMAGGSSDEWSRQQSRWWRQLDDKLTKRVALQKGCPTFIDPRERELSELCDNTKGLYSALRKGDIS